MGAKHVFIEKAQAMQKFDKGEGKVINQGIASTARYMKSAGIIGGSGADLFVRYQIRIA